MTPAHLWNRAQNGWSKCQYCGASRMYDWTPGWPGWYVYLDSKGNETDTTPSCNDGPLLELVK